jgi:hypothetical protein
MPRLPQQPTTARRKAGGGTSHLGHHSRGGTAASAAASSSSSKKKAPDPLHNGEQPCCQELATCCRHVLDAVKAQQQLDGGRGGGSTAPPTLPELVASYLSDVVQSMRASHHHNSSSPSLSPEGKDTASAAAAAAAAAASASKKKRNKKKKSSKKKKLAASSDEASSEAAAAPSEIPAAAAGDDSDHDDDNYYGDGDGTNDRSENQGGSYAGARGEVAAATTTVSVESNATASMSHAATTTPTSRPSPHNDVSSSPQHPPPTLFDLMVQDHFSGAATERIAAHRQSPVKNGSPKSISSPAKAASAAANHATTTNHNGQLFWDRILAESKRFHVRRDETDAAVAAIACPRCRSKVSDVLQGEHKIQIHSFRSHDDDRHPLHHRSTSLSVRSPSSLTYEDDDHPYRYGGGGAGDPSYYDYAQLEEGQLDVAALRWFREQQHDLHFLLTVGHDDDEEVGWKLRGMGLDANDDDDYDYEKQENGDRGDKSSGAENGGGGSSSTKKKKKGGSKGVSHAAAKAVATSGDAAAGFTEDWRKCVLYHYLLGRGLVSDDLIRNDMTNNNTQPRSEGAQVVEPKESDAPAVGRELLRSVASSALSTVTGYDSALKACKRSLEAQEELLAQNDEHYLGDSSGDDVNLTGFQILNDADQECCQIMKEQLQILLELSRWLFMASTAVRGDDSPVWQQIDLGHMQDVVLIMWESWMQVTQLVVSEIAQYESLLRDLTDRQGRFPLAFKSPAYRHLYRNLVRSKLRASACLVDKMHELFDTPLEVPGVNPHDRRASLSRKLVASSIYSQHFWGIDHTQHPPSTQLDEDMRGVLDSIRECVETTHQRTWMQVQQEHENRRQRLFRRCERVLTESSHLGCAAGVIRRMLVGSVSATSAPSVEQGDSSDSMDVDIAPSTMYRENLKGVGMQMVRGWLLERCHQRSSDDPVIPIMPLSLSVQIVNGLHEVGCDASCFTNAKTRAACILAAMFYRWMSDQCDAWRAEIVAQELLTSMAESEGPSLGSSGAALSTPSKSGKKKKKKGADGPSPSPLKTRKPVEVAQAPQLSNETADLPSVSIQATIVRATGTDDAPREDTSTFLGEAQAVNGTAKVSLSTADKEVPSMNGHKYEESDEPVESKAAAEELARSDSPGLSADGMSLNESVSALDAFVSIGVDNDSSFEPAGEFLVARLMSVLKHAAA